MTNNQHIACFGYGKTTQAIAKRFGPCTFFDDKVTKPFTDEEGNFLKPIQEFDTRLFTHEIPSPGFPPTHPLIQKATHLISEYDFFAPTMPFSIWISGTNGKTTTTQMVEHLLSDRGAISGGNIGTPLADLSPDAPIWILETSSFSMHYNRIAVPNIYALLPVTPDHVSWHGSMEAYYDAKLKPLSMMKEGEAIILPKMFADTPTNGFKILYENEKDLASYFGFDPKKIKFKGAFLMDAMIAMGMDKILYDRCDYDRINAFILDPHRQEEFRDSRDRLWINDSKATNIDATLAALRTYTDYPIHLILGGDDKGVELEELFAPLSKYDVAVYAIGANALRLEALCNQYAIPCTLCHTIDVAVEQISKKHTRHSVAMLSPAAASLDQFTSYAQRGNLFKELAKATK
ncbi:MAG: UDP-N-acetylmuramoyl-L-alanine--D-glutamate ligase [Sulfuricurvum sp.]|jgi:UDP-N-acetylmuramoylalanine--D-glutamate ligase|uniref:UDP-N-acetylmuramoyl-L-alanine--D-glutamate ligase n=1 Tax=Sulfuricurvum sp. TaxID=2025608 RepID=UPI0025D212C0|nr:UDP-N-acetylmuramoyl-L-alanine--D-glutamate ligase [Sulfuricurvum sp.]MCK9374366.1 UDP-N-acetylmuramoyl-L-alanine--D-glutamate ligase [Sulfuricurvum sp.]